MTFQALANEVATSQLRRNFYAIDTNQGFVCERCGSQGPTAQDGELSESLPVLPVDEIR